jgi:hypothetical protein
MIIITPAQRIEARAQLAAHRAAHQAALEVLRQARVAFAAIPGGWPRPAGWLALHGPAHQAARLAVEAARLEAARLAGVYSDAYARTPSW